MAADTRTRGLARLEKLAALMDDAYRIPGTRIHFGWDGLIGLIPGIGDAVSLASNVYLLWEARKLGVRKRAYLRMGWNVLVDMLLGGVPIAGDVLDVFWRSHRKNVRLIRAELGRRRQD